MPYDRSRRVWGRRIKVFCDGAGTRLQLLLAWMGWCSKPCGHRPGFAGSFLGAVLPTDEVGLRSCRDEKPRASERDAAALAKLEAETARRRKEVLAYVEEALAKQR